MDESDHIRDVYAYFGRAIYFAQALEQAIFVHLIFFDFYPKNAKTFKDQKDWEQKFNNYEAQELSKTMGRLIQKLKDSGQPTEEIKTILGEALKQRNRLAHHYFSENAVPFMSEAGRDSMILELESIQELFLSASQLIDDLTMPIARKYGLTEEKHQKIMDELLASGE